VFFLTKSVTAHLQLAVWGAILWTSEKTNNAKSMVPVLVSEQTLSHALAGNSSTYTVLWKWHWYLQNSSFYKTIKIMQHTVSTCDAVHRGAMWCWLLYCIMEWDSHSILMYFMLPKIICFKCFFEVIHFVSSGKQISTFHWKWISRFMDLIGPTWSLTLRVCCACITVF